jgi:hypothetical protein
MFDGANRPMHHQEARRRGHALRHRFEIAQHDFEPEGAADTGEERTASESIRPVQLSLRNAG